MRDPEHQCNKCGAVWTGLTVECPVCGHDNTPKPLYGSTIEQMLNNPNRQKEDE